MTLKFLAAAGALIALGLAWHLGHAPGWIAVLGAGALVSWGLDLDWRRKKRVAEIKNGRDRRRLRRFEREKSSREQRIDGQDRENG